MLLKQEMRISEEPFALLGILFALFSLWSPTPLKDRSDPVFSREIVAYELQEDELKEDGTVVYDYRGEELPAFLAESEVSELRTESSYTKRVATTDDGRPQYELVAYTNKVFVKEGGTWFARKTDSTNGATFAAARRENPIASLFWETAYADSISPFSGSGDGEIIHSGLSWGIRGAGTGSSANTSNSVFFAHSEFDGLSVYVIHRAFLPFDTSAITAGSTISAASLNIYITGGGVTNDENDGSDFLSVVRTSQTSHSSLATADYDAIGTTEGIDAGQRKDLTSITDGAYTTITLNATGIGWIAKSGDASNCSVTAGITCLGIREGHDLLNDTPTAANSVSISSFEETGTTQDPYLSVTYTPPAGGATRVMRLYGNIRFLGGVRLLGL